MSQRQSKEPEKKRKKNMVSLKKKHYRLGQQPSDFLGEGGISFFMEKKMWFFFSFKLVYCHI